MKKTATLLLNLQVNKLLPRPLNSSVGIGLFRMAIEGDGVEERSVSLLNNVPLVIERPRERPVKVLVVRTEAGKEISVTLTSVDGETSILKCNNLLVVTQDLMGVELEYSDRSTGAATDATVSIIYT